MIVAAITMRNGRLTARLLSIERLAASRRGAVSVLAEAPRPSGALLEGMTQHGVQGRGEGGSEARAVAARARALRGAIGAQSVRRRQISSSTLELRGRLMGSVNGLIVDGTRRLISF